VPVQVPVDDIVNKLLSSCGSDDTMGLPFAEYGSLLSEHYAADRMIECPVGAKCKGCELDTMAMVLIWERWAQLVRAETGRV
jgi:hypothetical protein